MKAFDVLVAGAGPGGCASALAFAQRDASVLLIEPRWDSAGGLAGELLLPGGVEALRRLGVELDGWGFRHQGLMVHPGPGEDPLVIPYGEDESPLTMPHEALVHLLRGAAKADERITLLTEDRVAEVAVDGRVCTTRGAFRAGLVVGADGRSSVVRRALRPGEPAPVFLSHTAGVLVTGVSLQAEGYLNMFLGGPRVATAYRITPDAIRVCIDVPKQRPNRAELLGFLADAYAPVLPGKLGSAFVEAVEASRIQWAANRFRRRSYFGHGRCALVGDAVGQGHPLAALGMAEALLDAECLARHPADLAAYGRERRASSWAAEHAGAALHLLVGAEPESRLLCQTLLDQMRDDTRQRERVIRMLTLHDDRRRTFVAVMARLTVDVIPRLLSSRRRQGATLPELIRWLLRLFGPQAGIPPYSRGAR